MLGSYHDTEEAMLEMRLRVALVATRANGQPALAAFDAGSDGGLRPYRPMVLELDGDAIATITGFSAFRGPTPDKAFGLRPRQP